MPPEREDLVIQRILVRHGFTRAMADELLIEMQAVLDQLDSLSDEEALSMVEAGGQAQGHDHSGR
jgi:glutamate decarboxylase